MPRQITLSQTVTEDIITIYEVPATMVRVCVAPVNPDGTMVNGNVYDEYQIQGDDFAELMSAGPSWAPNKPANTYRNEDLWVFVDRFRSQS